jgi:hypothetical protein
MDSKDSSSAERTSGERSSGRSKVVDIRSGGDKRLK